MAKLEMKLSVTDMEPIKSLITVLIDNYDNLPKAVQDKIIAIAEDADGAENDNK